MNKNIFWQNWGTTQFEITGLNFDKLLNELVLKNIKISKLKKCETTLFLTVKNSYCTYLIDLLKQRCYNFSIKKQSGVSAILNFVLNRWGIMVGLIFSIMIFDFFSCFVVDVVVENDTANLETEITQCLKQNDIAIGKIKFGQDVNEIEKCILDNVKSISMVSASFRGTSLIVSYTVKTDVSSILENVQKQNIVALNSGIVTSISVVSGTALVKVGDAVTKGQVLIAGYKMVGDEKVECFASGTVFANVFKSATVSYAINQIDFVQTGNVLSGYNVKLNDTVIISNVPNVEFKKYETKTIQQQISNILPLYIETFYFYELEAVETVGDYENCKQNLIASARLLAFENVNDVDNVVDENFDENCVADVWFVTYTIKIKEKIS